MKLIERDVICGECGEVIDHEMHNEQAAERIYANGQYFQFMARDAMNAHVAESKVPHTGSTEKIEFGKWNDEV